MPAYVSLMKFTPQGAAKIKGSPERAKSTRADIAKSGGRLIGIWYTMREYDAVMIVEAPDEMSVAIGTLDFLREGTATTQTMRAFSEEEFAQIVSKLP